MGSSECLSILPKTSTGFFPLMTVNLLLKESANILLATCCWVAGPSLLPATCINPTVTGSQLTPGTFLERESVSPSLTFLVTETQKVVLYCSRADRPAFPKPYLKIRRLNILCVMGSNFVVPRGDPFQETGKYYRSQLHFSFYKK